MRLIDADALRAQLMERAENGDTHWKQIRNDIDDAPTIPMWHNAATDPPKKSGHYLVYDPDGRWPFMFLMCKYVTELREDWENPYWYCNGYDEDGFIGIIDPELWTELPESLVERWRELLNAEEEV